ncbi:hypothetical protein FDF12_09885 [Clostridium botulinum]|uniref:hypothetical protein n=1 Tax=unclassified Clostridium TaxID=2614128 RepID=UPI0013F048B5|nr:MULTISPECIES: hypothetical protein [unclassified Clostridium]NFS28758.1 hypothetical protein [Clostridium botulinum]NFS55193.1 hypothetical protein [Clostridium botulinum]NFT17682.1 hypothetical protein [Clostridium botulinum]
MENLTQAFTRIKNINWNNTLHDKPSHIILVNEFIKRGNVFRDVYDKDNTKRLAVFSAAQTINASIPEDIQRFIDDVKLIEHGWTIKAVCEYYLEWVYLVEVGDEVAIKYNTLYEPIIKLFERGGRISYHNQELICGKVGWPRNCYFVPRKNFIEEISDEILDNIDL